MIVSKEYKEKLLIERDGNTATYKVEADRCLAFAAEALDEHDDPGAIAWALVGLLVARLEEE